MATTAAAVGRKKAAPSREPVGIATATEADVGWTPEPQERCDFLHRTRVFPPTLQDWRKALVAKAETGELASLGIASVADSFRTAVDASISWWRELARILAVTHPGIAARPLTIDAAVARVATRLGALRQLGSDTSATPAMVKRLLPLVMPANLQQTLGATLTQHAREVCHAVRPQCGSCTVRNFCHAYRSGEAERVEASGAPTVIDLFSGAGGSSDGFTREGFRVVAALDADDVALRTYALNHPAVRDEAVLCADIRNVGADRFRALLKGRPLDVLIGSPPCQGFSHAGHRSKASRTGYRVAKDDRNWLFEDMLALALDLKPALFLLENVPGMQSARRESLSFLESAARVLETKGGYRTAVWRLNSAAVGVPQDRIRWFVVASRTGFLPARPVEEYRDIHRPDFELDALPATTLGDAIWDLPAREANEGTPVVRWAPTATTAPRTRRYLSKFGILRSDPVLYNHTVRYNNERDLELYALLQPGEDSVHAIERYGRTDLMRYRRDVFDDKYARLRADRPSKTIVSHLAKDGNGYIHPEQTRSISIREAARVQSFHDGYAFCGSPSDQWVQVGNAVPPILAAAIARSFRQTLTRGIRS